ncbi:hypothetical protein BC629DRAFT_1598275 [Irpex lacteus]|nr:hypothetical protein BC629DRAFT_1598275 [Irpex lacteus]
MESWNRPIIPHPDEQSPANFLSFDNADEEQESKVMLYRHIAAVVAMLFSAVFVFAVPAAAADAASSTKRDQPASLDQLLTSAAQAFTVCQEELQALSPDDRTMAKLLPILNGISSIANEVEDDIEKASLDYTSTDTYYTRLVRSAKSRVRFITKVIEFIQKHPFDSLGCDAHLWQVEVMRGKLTPDDLLDTSTLLDTLAEIIACV